KHAIDDLDAIFAPANIPQGATQAQWDQAKASMKTTAQQAYSYVFVLRKNHPKAETELTKFLQLAPTQTQFAYFLGSEFFAQGPDKYVPGLYQMARAAAYDGPGSVAATRTQAKNFLDKNYVQFHGSNEGLNELLAVAKNNPFPPAGFSIKS